MEKSLHKRTIGKATVMILIVLLAALMSVEVNAQLAAACGEDEGGPGEADPPGICPIVSCNEQGKELIVDPDCRVCGDGILHAGLNDEGIQEKCDDGCTSVDPMTPANCDLFPLSDGDGCNSQCQKEKPSGVDISGDDANAQVDNVKIVAQRSGDTALDIGEGVDATVAGLDIGLGDNVKGINIKGQLDGSEVRLAVIDSATSVLIDSEGSATIAGLEVSFEEFPTGGITAETRAAIISLVQDSYTSGSSVEDDVNIDIIRDIITDEVRVVQNIDPSSLLSTTAGGLFTFDDEFSDVTGSVGGISALIEFVDDLVGVQFPAGTTIAELLITPSDADGDGIPDKTDPCKDVPSTGGHVPIPGTIFFIDCPPDNIIVVDVGVDGTAVATAQFSGSSGGSVTITVDPSSGANPGDFLVIEIFDNLQDPDFEGFSAGTDSFTLAAFDASVVDGTIGQPKSVQVSGSVILDSFSGLEAEDLFLTHQDTLTGDINLVATGEPGPEGATQFNFDSSLSKFLVGVQGCNQGNFTLTSTLNTTDSFVFQGEEIFNYSLEEELVAGITQVTIGGAAGFEVFDGACRDGVAQGFDPSLSVQIPQAEPARLFCAREIGTTNMFELQNVVFGPGEESRNMSFRAIGVQRFCDQDGDGLTNDADQCNSASGPAEQAGCPFADLTIATLEIIDREKSGVCGFKPNGKVIKKCKEPLADLPIKVFDREDADFITAFGTKRPNKQFLDDIYEADIGLIGECTTDAAGECIAGEDHPGKFLVVGKFSDAATNTTVYTGKFKDFFDDDNDEDDDDEEDDEDDDDCDDDGDGDCNDDIAKTLIKKKLKVLKIINKDGTVKYKAGYSTIVQGSRLEVLHLEYEVWEDTTELYPFAFTSNETWDIDVCAHVPTGYSLVGVEDDNGTIISTTNCTQTLVQNDTKLLFFDLLETSSPEPNMGFTFTVSHEGEEQVVNVPISGVREWTEEETEAEVDARVKEVKAKLQPATVSEPQVVQPEVVPAQTTPGLAADSEPLNEGTSAQVETASSDFMTDLLVALGLIGVLAAIIVFVNKQEKE